MTAALAGFLVILFCTAMFVILSFVWPDPLVEPIADCGPLSKIERVHQVQDRAAYHRKVLEALADEFVELHGYGYQDVEAAELLHVIWDGGDYPDAMVRIMDMKRTK